jgi:hypothetical protein
MFARPVLALAAAAALVGCAPALAPLPPAPSGVKRIAVDEPVNRTGGDLVVERPGLFGELIREKTSTVPELLGADLCAVLERQGFALAKTVLDDVPVLRTEIRRWEPYSADYSMVTVDLVASLVEPGSGRELWSAARTDWNVPTTYAHSRRDASAAAASAVAEALLAGWQP